jgi:hypothetical protein
VSLRFLADENFQRVIVRGVLRELPDLDILRVQDIDLGGIDDPGILTWAARQGRVLLTHDAKTIPRFAYDRIERGELMTGVLVIPQHAAVARAIEAIVLAAGASREDEWQGQVRYLSLR